MNLFCLDNLNYAYPTNGREAIRDLNLSINEGEFVLVLGPSGSGKTTFARVLSGLIPEFYGGKLTGEILFRGKPLTGELNYRREVGIVFQNPERQLLANRVEHELVLGLENLGFSQDEMKHRLAQTLSFLNLELLRTRETKTLSGGEKQRVVLGSIFAMGPRVLILDEPTSQLDPSGTQEVFQLLQKLNRDLRYTVILVEQRSRSWLGLASRILFFEDGKLVKDVLPRDFADSSLRGYAVPGAVSEQRDRRASLSEARDDDQSSFVHLSRLTFGYKSRPQLFHGFDLRIPAGSCTALLGENGAGKSTLLRLIAGLLTPESGWIEVGGKRADGLHGAQRISLVGYLPQQPDDFLFHDTVYEEAAYSLRHLNICDRNRVHSILEQLKIDRHSETTPRDLSAGERVRTALAAVLAAQPRLLLLDEPTRGLDPQLRLVISRIFLDYVSEGDKTILFATQDLDFADEFADQKVWLPGGQVVNYT
jgi:energy-coupling factor transport system ATP-binding protein